MKRRFTNEFKIGIFLLAAAAVGTVFFVKTNNMKAGQTYEIKTTFNYAGGIKANSIATLTGIEVGRVTKVEFEYEPTTKVNVTIALDNSAKVRTDAIAYISNAGFIGDCYIGITAGKSSTFVQPGESIASEDPLEMRELMKKADAIAGKLDATLTDVRSMAANLSSNVNDTLGNFKQLGINLNSMVQDNRPKVDGIMKNVESMTANLDELSADIKQHPWKLLIKGKE